MIVKFAEIWFVGYLCGTIKNPGFVAWPYILLDLIKYANVNKIIIKK